MKTGGTSSSNRFIMDKGIVSLKLYRQKGTTNKLASLRLFRCWDSSTIVTWPWLSKKTTLNLSLPVLVQDIITPLCRSCSVMVILKKWAHCRSTVPDTVWPQSRVSTLGISKPGTCVAPDPMCMAAVKTFCVISVGTGMPAFETKAPKRRPTVPKSSTLTDPKEKTQWF